MQANSRHGKVFDGLWLLVCFAMSAVWCLSAGARLGATFDEPLYLARGLEGWRAGSHRGLLKVGTMPLPIDVQTLPLYVWERWTDTPLDPVADCHRLLPFARAGTLVFWAILLAYGWLVGRRLGGPWGGRLAVALLATEPSLLAHASLATTDVAVSACLVALAYHFRTNRSAGWWWRVALPGAWFGAAVLAKASGLVFGGLCLIVLEAERLLNEGQAPGQRWWSATAGFRRDAVQIVLIGLAVMFVYCGSDWQPEPSFLAWAKGLPDGPGRSVALGLAENLRVFSNGGEGIVRQVKHNVRGHGVFLLGEVHPRALWYYFPVALSVKLTLTVLLLPIAVAATRARALANWAFLAAAALLAFSVTCRVQIGIRLVLPLVVFLVVGLAVALARAWQASEGSTWRRRLLAGATGAGLLWAVGSTTVVWPNGLCYTNELWGGTAKGYLRLSDSNYDWGQGLGELARWQEQKGLERLDVWYFGTDPILTSLAMDEAALHVTPIAKPDDVPTKVKGRYLAAATTLVYGLPVATDSHRRASAYLRAKTPVARTSTFLIYDLGAEKETTRRPEGDPDAAPWAVRLP